MNSKSANTEKHTKASALLCLQLSYPVGQILETIIQLSRDGVNARLDHPIDCHLQLVLSQAKAEPLLKGSDR